MKTYLSRKSIPLVTLLMLGLIFQSFSQLSKGGIHADFGVDADTKAGFVKYGPSTGLISTDDWFGPMTGLSRGIMDTSNAAFYKTQLQANKNISFIKRMFGPMYSKVNNTLWLDGIYARDYISQRNLTGAVISEDSTSFIGGAKNGDHPATWSSTTFSVPDKTDFIDVYAHMRRNGLTVNDSLWFFSSVSTAGTAGNRYYDVELYKNDITHNRITGSFTTAGTDQGHTSWKFDAGGNIIQTGDMIIAVNLSTGSVPVIDVRIWVAYATFNTALPTLFKWGSYTGSTSAGGFGYASITSNNGTTEFGSGIGNYTITTITDTTDAGPWGSINIVGAGHQWSSNFQSLQLVEVGINLTRIGVDPGLYTAFGNDACDEIFSSILFKSRSSSSFTAALQDFVPPIEFLNLPSLNYSVQTDTISCTKPMGLLKITNNTSSGHFTWKTIGGNIASSNPDSTTVSVSAPGKYVVQASQHDGCPIKGNDTLIVLADTLKPVVTANIGSNAVGQPKLLGGDTTLSNYSTRFGGSQGLLWNWTGPNGFNSTVQNPITINNNWGTYSLTVTEKRNGCSVSSSVYVNFSLLKLQKLEIEGSWLANTVVLSWKITDGESVSSYEIERSYSATSFQTIGKVHVVDASVKELLYKDKYPVTGGRYRVKAITISGNIYYSSVITVNSPPTGKKAYLINTYNSNNKPLYLIANADQNANLKIVTYDISGKILKTQQIYISKGINTVEILSPHLKINRLTIIRVYIGGEIILTEKVLG